VAFTYVSASSAAGAQALARELSVDGRRALAIQADAADASAVRGAVDRAIAELGPIDVLVNNAGIFLTGAIGETSLDDY